MYFNFFSSAINSNFHFQYIINAFVIWYCRINMVVQRTTVQQSKSYNIKEPWTPEICYTRIVIMRVLKVQWYMNYFETICVQYDRCIDLVHNRCNEWM